MDRNTTVEKALRLSQEKGLLLTEVALHDITADAYSRGRLCEKACNSCSGAHCVKFDGPTPTFCVDAEEDDHHDNAF